MLGQWQSAPREREHTAEPRAWYLVIPLLLLFGFSVAVRSADSSAEFRINQRAVLASLREKIAQSAALETASAPPAVAEGEGTDDVAAAAITPIDELREVKETVRRGDTFGSILKRVGVASSEVSRWSATTHEHVSLRRLLPGRVFTFLIPSGTDQLAGLQYELAPDATLVMRQDEDAIVGQVIRVPRMVATRVVSGAIENNLYTAAQSLGMPDSVISNLVDIFGWDIDFTTDLHPGDTFRVSYEESRDAEGRRIDGGKVLAAELVIRGRVWDAVYFEAADDGGSYYSKEGKAFGRSFLRYPLEFTRITSTFTSSRFHPVLRINRPHLGVDFAAPIGTPIRAIAAGQVEMAGWNGGSGRYVKIDHGQGLESSYSHLSAIFVRSGARVQVGQVVGAVGASGLATGPHLHFALFRSGVYVNPITFKLPAAPPLPAKYMREFVRIRDEALQQLARAEPDEDQVTVRLASGPAATRVE
jgi:murein DD-endopeptidase MepM/ murein hydrolase activator NlpD